MNLYVLTSSRADYGIYYPLLKKLEEDNDFDLKLIVFGTHLSKFHGYTISAIKKDGFEIAAEIENVLSNDSEEAISTSMALTSMKFAALWKENKPNIDLVIALGDRYEMFSAIAASVPFNIPIAHLHGGETTLGAIDDKLRHSITLFSKYHFTSTEKYADRVKMLIGNETNVWNVGALSLDNITELTLFTKDEFLERFAIDLEIPTILVTLHPETIASGSNKQFAIEVVKTLEKQLVEHQVVITMPNADTEGNVIREEFINFGKNKKVVLIENFGSLGYFSCIKYCSFLLGNTSSGIIEAASFGKYVVNVGNRQEGRLTGDNVIHVPIEEEAMVGAINFIKSAPLRNTDNIYYQGGATNKIIQVLKELDNEKI